MPKGYFCKSKCAKIHYKLQHHHLTSCQRNCTNTTHIEKLWRKMRPINSAPSASGIRIWRSPIPYLFGGLTLLLVLISVALVILVCSHRKHASRSSAEIEDTKQAMPNKVEIDIEPRILVIMAGDDKPTYLPKPITPSNCCTCEADPAPSSSSISVKILTNWLARNNNFAMVLLPFHIAVDLGSWICQLIMSIYVFLSYK